MRFIPALVTASVFALSACLDEASDLDEIGKFNVTINGEAAEFTSYYDNEVERSLLQLLKPAGIRMILIDATKGLTDGSPDYPILSMTLQSGMGADSGMHIESIEFLSGSPDGNLMARRSWGIIDLQDLVMTDDGEISFSFAADLVLAKENQGDGAAYIVTEGAEGSHIEGSYSGIFPASELE